MKVHLRPGRRLGEITKRTYAIQVSYELSSFGMKFVTLFMPLATWDEGALAKVVAARTGYDLRKAEGLE